MRRREFIALVGGAAAGWPLAARAQQGERMRRVGVLMLYAENDPEGQGRTAAFRQALEKAGWRIGGNLQIDYHWGVGDVDWMRSAAARLLRQAPDVILANGGPALRSVQQAAGTVPVIFIGGGSDPVAEGFVQSLAHPGGNITGFTVFEASLGAKLLGLLKEIAPRVTCASIIVNPDNPAGRRLSDAAMAAGQKLAVEVAAAPVRRPDEIEAAITRAGRQPGCGLIVPPDPSINTHRKLIVDLAARQRLPAIYALRAAAADGGLMSYGVDLFDLFLKAGGYADRILKGEKPADLPVQAPTKFEMVINLKTATTLGLDVPVHLQQLADEVIE